MRLAQRRPTLVRFLTALLVFRIVTTITQIIEHVVLKVRDADAPRSG